MHVREREAVTKLNEIQQSDEQNGDRQVQAHLELDSALLAEGEFWRSEARIKWHCDGNWNTTYFHKIAKVKRGTQHIACLHKGERKLYTGSLE